MTFQWVIAWWNLIFVVPFGVALIYLGVYTATGGLGEDASGDSDADADVDHDIEADADADHDLEHDVEHGAEQDAEQDGTDQDGASSGGRGVAISALALIGAGRIPIGLAVMILLLAWGAIGFATNQILHAMWKDAESLLAAASIPTAMLGSIFITRCVAMTVARFLPNSETYARPRHDLLGTTGKAVFDINETFGLVAVRDHGELFQVPCKVEVGKPPIAKGSSVLLIGYSKTDKTFRVVLNETEAGM